MESRHEYVTNRSGIVMKNLADFLPTGLGITFYSKSYLRTFVDYLRTTLYIISLPSYSISE